MKGNNKTFNQVSKPLQVQTAFVLLSIFQSRRGEQARYSTDFTAARSGDFIMASLLKKFWNDEDGATMVEYGLMLALIAVVCIGDVTSIGTGANGMFQTVSAALAAGS
ncbi:MAG: Flp family type IVb pilin [Planctomycetales bacterium]